MIDRRAFASGLALGAAAFAARAQVPGKVARVGYLSSSARPSDAELQ